MSRSRRAAPCVLGALGLALLAGGAAAQVRLTQAEFEACQRARRADARGDAAAVENLLSRFAGGGQPEGPTFVGPKGDVGLGPFVPYFMLGKAQLALGKRAEGCAHLRRSLADGFVTRSKRAGELERLLRQCQGPPAQHPPLRTAERQGQSAPPVPQPELVGACTIPLLDCCVPLTARECRLAAGLHAGDGTRCRTTPCPAP